MTTDLARLVAPSGATFSAPFHNLTPRSVFVAGHVPLGFDEPVKAFLLGHAVDARVAFNPAEPPGVVLTFEATPELEAAIFAFRRGSSDDWGDQDETRTHDARGAARRGRPSPEPGPGSPLGRDLDRFDADAEEPTNPGARSLASLEEEVTPPSLPAVDAERRARDPALQEGLQQGLSRGREGPSARLRATTQVSPVDDGDED
jgi:hypothetical protein